MLEKRSIRNRDVKTYCICKKPNDENQAMIECYLCKDWFHFKCVNMNSSKASSIENYECPGCLSGKKPIASKNNIKDNKRKNEPSNQIVDDDVHRAKRRKILVGTAEFCKQLLERKFSNASEDNLLCELNNGSELTLGSLDEHGFKRPIFVQNKDNLGLVVPSSDEINLTKIENIVGSDYVIEVIDVEKQAIKKITLNELSTYYETKPRNKIYNVLSFEISKTKLNKIIKLPSIVLQLSWAFSDISRLAVKDSINSGSIQNFAEPAVHKYCLISAANSFTDFHIDFGGSSVWYHVVKGEKIFYLIEPTQKNLNIYEEWYISKNNRQVFLGDNVEKCYEIKIKEGNTIFLPTGWIHAVYTPLDSLVFGGNFLHSRNIPLQLNIYEMELRFKLEEQYKFPAFESWQWRAAIYYTKKLKDLNSTIDVNLLQGIKYLKETLKRWLKENSKLHKCQVPQKINANSIISELELELNKS